MNNENLKISGQLNIVLKDAAGNIKEDRLEKNLVVNAGLEYIAQRMTGTSSSVMSHMALGSGTTAPNALDTDLGSILGTRSVLTHPAPTASGVVYYSATFGPDDSTGAVTEAGIFNAASSGDMLCRTTFGVVNKAADDTLSVTWTITLSAS